eukprot:Skav214921  [mRNA]  locus=scaffold2073:185023:189856:+ [translate_table: standard]
MVLRCLVIVGHAPHRGNSVEVIEGFWADIRSHIPTAYDSWESHLHPGETGTWRHASPSATWKRLDYIGLPVAWNLTSCRSWVSFDIDVTTHKDDHRPTLIHLTMPAQLPVRWRRPSTPQLCMDHLNEDKLDQLASWTFPPDQDVHSQTLEIQSYLIQAFGRRRHRPHRPLKPTMSEETWQLVKEKQSWRRTMHQMSALQRKSKLLFNMDFWKQFATWKRLKRTAPSQMASSRWDWDFGSVITEMTTNQHGTAWMHGIMADLRWFAAVLPGRLPEGWDSNFGLIIDIWQDPTFPWKPLVKKMVQLHQQQDRLAWDGEQLHHEIFQTLREGGCSFTPEPFADETEEFLPFACTCGRRFTTGQGLATHRRKAHSVYSPEHTMVGGSQCPCCHRELWSSQRLQQHLAYIPAGLGYNPCYQFLASIGFETVFAAVPLPKEFRGLNRAEALPGYGPALNPQTLVEKQLDTACGALRDMEALLAEVPSRVTAASVTPLFADLSAATMGWFERFQSRGFRAEPSDDLQDAWLGALGDLMADDSDLAEYAFLTWGSTTMEDVAASFLDGEAEYLLDAAFADLAAALPRQSLLDRRAHLAGHVRQLQADVAQPRLFPHRPPRDEQAPSKGVNRSVDQEVPRTFADQDRWMTQLRAVRWFDLPRTWKLPLYHGLVARPALIFFHAFSGRRRNHDFHFWLKELGKRRGFEIFILSLDTAVHPELGNLSRASVTWSRLLQCLRSGSIAGSLIGPPCETYSEARHHRPVEPEEDCDVDRPRQRWPRPLRSKERILGLDGLTGREMKQLQVGTAFLYQAFHIMALHMVWGGYTVIEHPGIPSEPSRASAWSTAIAELYRLLPSTKLHCLQQWRWGARAVKPTGFLVHAMPKFHSSMWACRDEGASYPTEGVIGRDALGNYRTSALKEYPGQLCFGLASAFLDQAQADIASGKSSAVSGLPPAAQDWIQEVTKASSTIRLNAAMGADYQGC